MRYRLTEPALLDLDEIYDAIAADSPARAAGVIDRIFEGLSRLAQFPRAGVARPELGEATRSLVVGTYVIYYELEPQAVLVLRVLHGARDQLRHFESDP